MFNAPTPELARATMDEKMRIAAHRRTVRAFKLQRRNHRAARGASPDGRVRVPLFGRRPRIA
jgi:hypothetical protein